MPLSVAQVMGSALSTDPRCLRLLAVADPVVIELRERLRIAEGLSGEAGASNSGATFQRCSSLKTN
jgi:hypothetical protein